MVDFFSVKLHQCSTFYSKERANKISSTQKWRRNQVVTNQGVKGDTRHPQRRWCKNCQISSAKRYASTNSFIIFCQQAIKKYKRSASMIIHFENPHSGSRCYPPWQEPGLPYHLFDCHRAKRSHQRRYRLVYQDPKVSRNHRFMNEDQRLAANLSQAKHE